jgi:hypothetical protein
MTADRRAKDLTELRGKLVIRAENAAAASPVPRAVGITVSIQKALHHFLRRRHDVRELERLRLAS